MMINENYENNSMHIISAWHSRSANVVLGR